MKYPELDPKTLVAYPLSSMVLFLIAHLIFDIPLVFFFILLGLNVLYVIVFIVIEVNRKDH